MALKTDELVRRAPSSQTTTLLIHRSRLNPLKSIDRRFAVLQQHIPPQALYSAHDLPRGMVIGRQQPATHLFASFPNEWQ
jgi:hypothetical protein